MSDEFEQELARRMRALEDRMASVERMNDGWRDEEKNVWVPGSLQMLTDLGARVATLSSRVDVLTRALWFSGALMSLVVAHQYGLAELLLRLIGSPK